MEIKTVVIPAAGWGTRFLPFTKAVPKEMVPLLNKPAIHYIMQEAVTSGITECALITATHKRALLDYFNPQPTLDTFLAAHDKAHLLAELNALSARITINPIIQQEALGLGHAVGLASAAVTGDYVAIMLPDEIMLGHDPALKQLIAIARLHNASVIAVQEVPAEQVSSYGIVSIAQKISPSLFQIDNIVEKPSRDTAPSRYAVIGRYILSRDIFNELDTLAPSANGEIQLTDAIQGLIARNHPVFACILKTDRHDVGNPQGWLNATMALARAQKIL